MQRVLHIAATKVPYYRRYWQERKRRGDLRSWQILGNWPILEKAELRACPEAFINEDYNRSRMYAEHTSGTTGKPLQLWWSRESMVEWFALSEARWRHWYGVSRKDRWAILGGQLVTPVGQHKPPFWVWNAPMQQLYMSVYHLSPDLIPHYLHAIEKYEIRYLLGYTSALHTLARHASGALQHRKILKAVIANAEPVLQWQRESVFRTFGCPLRETYGMAEMAAAAGECEHGRLHLWPEISSVESVGPDGEPLPAGEIGDLVCTGLMNLGMPLIRYRVGDRGALSPASLKCECGRSLPVMQAVEGRRDDVLLTKDGREIGRLDPVFKTDLPIEEAQIVQENLDNIRIRVVPDPAFNSDHERILRQRLRDRIGDVTVHIERLTSIPREKNGKFRAVICNLKPEAANAATSVAEHK